MSLLFTPFYLGSSEKGLQLPNRIVVAPMCQYAAHNGLTSDWHLMHWGNLLNSGAGLFIIEATAVVPEGRITPACLGLWDDATEAAMSDTLRRARALAPQTAVCIQLAHAGRKASSALPWQGAQLLSPAQGGWETVAPSAVPHLPHETPPTAMTQADMERVRDASQMPTIAVGLITQAQQAEAILQAGDADLIALARAFLYNPRWGWHAAAELGGQVAGKENYWRSLPPHAQTIFGKTVVGMR